MNQIHILLSRWKTKKYIDQEIHRPKNTSTVYKKLNVTDGAVPRSYGLPKIHKEGNLLRMIVSCINSLLHPLASYLKDIISPLLLVLANLVIHDLEKNVLSNMRINISVYYRYVDDILLMIPNNQIYDILDSFKSYHNRLSLINLHISHRLKSLGMIQKQGNWVPYELKPRNVERRFSICEMLLVRHKRKDFLHRIVTGDEKWIHYNNPKKRKSWGSLGHASTSTAKPNITLYRTQLMRLSRALKKKRAHYYSRHDKIILLHDNARPHVAAPVKTYIELNWEVEGHVNLFMITKEKKRMKENQESRLVKGVFPYVYVDCEKETELPSRESLYSSLTGDTVSESDYAHAVNISQQFSIRTFGEYSDLYLKTDVLLLADIFENFRNIFFENFRSCITNYEFDPVYYYTLPSFIWDTMLKPSKLSSYLMYYDVNNLYERSCGVSTSLVLVDLVSRWPFAPVELDGVGLGSSAAVGPYDASFAAAALGVAVAVELLPLFPSGGCSSACLVVGTLTNLITP
ncbi:MOS1T transposase, partial [Pseudoatta argentina]